MAVCKWEVTALLKFVSSALDFFCVAFKDQYVMSSCH